MRGEEFLIEGNHRASIEESFGYGTAERKKKRKE